ncbi:hypothetical protein ABBQ32_000392 [Trebouxia sp. C0010 RCD-2024]
MPSYLADYLDVLPAPIAGMTDAVLIVEEARFPVHSAMLAANSAVFDDLFCAEEQHEIILEIPLPGDQASNVHTALKYIYAGYPLRRCRECATESFPRIKSTDDAKAVITFAHKYTCTSLLEACEAYLVGLAQKDMSGDPVDQYHLFSSNQAILFWAELAEACEMDTLLAHCELSMIRDRDELLWHHPALTTGKISRSCLLRMLRASHLAMQRIKVDIATLKSGKKVLP